METAARAAEARVATLAVPAEAAEARSEGSARRPCLDTPRRQRRWATCARAARLASDCTVGIARSTCLGCTGAYVHRVQTFVATYLYEHVAVWSSCALVVQRLRCLVPTRLAEAAIQRRGAALQLHAVAEWCRARGRRRRERPLASLLSVAAKALGLLARPRIAPGRARCHFGTYAVDVEALGRAKRAVVAPLASLGDSITDHVDM